MLACFARCCVVKFIKSFCNLRSISTNDGLNLSTIQIEFEGWKRPDIIGLAYITALISINAAVNNIGIFVLTRKTFKGWLEIHARTAPGSPKIYYHATAIFYGFRKVSLVLDF